MIQYEQRYLEKGGKVTTNLNYCALSSNSSMQMIKKKTYNQTKYALQLFDNATFNSALTIHSFLRIIGLSSTHTPRCEICSFIPTQCNELDWLSSSDCAQ